MNDSHSHASADHPDVQAAIHLLEAWSEAQLAYNEYLACPWESSTTRS